LIRKDSNVEVFALVEKKIKKRRKRRKKKEMQGSDTKGMIRSLKLKNE